MENLTELVQSSVRNVRNKVVPQRVATSSSSFEGDLLVKQSLYDYFGLDFKSRTTREMQDVNKKIDVIREYLTENFDDLSAGLAAIERQGGAVPADGNLLDHFYRAVKYKNQAFESLPKEEKTKQESNRLKDVQDEIERARAELKSGAERLKEAKELQKLTARLARLEEMKKIREVKLAELTKAINDSTPSTTV